MKQGLLLQDLISHRGGRGLVIVLVLGCCVLADVSILHVAWLQRYFDPGQLAWGYFEPSADGPRLVTDGFGARGADLDMALASAARLWISPGKPLIFPIGPETDLTVTTSGEGWAPYLVFGGLAPFRPTSSRSGGEVQALSHARRLEFGAGGFSLVAWDATRSWEQDVGGLRAAAGSCGRERPSASVHVVSLKDVLLVEYGVCRLEVPFDDANPSVIALLPGPAAMLVESATAWKTHHAVAWRALQIVSALACATVALLFVGLGLWSCLLLSSVPVLFLVWSPLAGILAWLATAVVGGLFCCWTFVEYLRRSKRPVIGIAVVALAGVALVWFQRGRTNPSAETPADGDRSVAKAGALPGVLLGYSAVAGGALRPGSDGLPEHLRRLGHAYVDPLSQRAFSAQTFSRIEECICHEFDGVPKGAVVLFFGGTNDDWYSGIQMGSWSTLRMLLGWLQFMSDSRRWERSGEIFAEAVRSSQAVLPRQRQVIGKTVGCARARGQHFVFFHDFLVSDLDGALSPERRQMREAREDTVTAAGGEFVDLFDELHREAGVAWYNDIIHPSSVGHERFAARIVRYLAASPRLSDEGGQQSE